MSVHAHREQSTEIGGEVATSSCITKSVIVGNFQEETQGVNPIRRRQRLSASGSQHDPEADVRKHAFRPPRFRKSHRNKCSDRDNDDNFDNYDEDDEDREESSVMANNNSTDFGTSPVAVVAQGIQPSATGGPSSGETTQKASCTPLLQSGSGTSPSGVAHPQSADQINARIDNLSR